MTQMGPRWPVLGSFLTVCALFTILLAPLAVAEAQDSVPYFHLLWSQRKIAWDVSWNPATGNFVFSRDGGIVEELRPRTGEVVWRENFSPPGLEERGPNLARSSGDGRYLAMGNYDAYSSLSYTDRQRNITILDYTKGREAKVLQAPGRVLFFEWNRDEPVLTVLTENDTRDYPEGLKSVLASYGSPPDFDLRWTVPAAFGALSSGIRNRVATMSARNDTLSIYDAETGSLVFYGPGTFGSYALSWSPDGTILAQAGSRLILRTAPSFEPIEVNTSADSIVWSRDGSYLYVNGDCGGEALSLCMVTPATRDVILLQSDFPSGRMEMSSDGRFLATTALQGVYEILPESPWDLTWLPWVLLIGLLTAVALLYIRRSKKRLDSLPPNEEERQNQGRTG
jgi:WD40 repeat protein